MVKVKICVLSSPGPAKQADRHRGFQWNHSDLWGGVWNPRALQQGIHRHVPHNRQQCRDWQVYTQTTTLYLKYQISTFLSLLVFNILTANSSFIQVVPSLPTSICSQDSKQFRWAAVKGGGDPQQQEEVGGGAEGKGSGSKGDRQENEQPEAWPHAAQEDPRSIPAVSLSPRCLSCGFDNGEGGVMDR